MSTATQSQSSASVFLDRASKDANETLSKLESQVREIESHVAQALAEVPPLSKKGPHQPETTEIWGVPFSRLTLSETLHHIDRLIAWDRPGYFITANLNYNMLTAKHPELAEINAKAQMIVCDGMPMVWRSRLSGTPLPERLAGSELIYALSQWASIKGHRIFFLGGAPGVASAAAKTLQDRYPGLLVAGVESPPFRPQSLQEHDAMIQRIRDSKPAILFVAFGQPKGERWIAENVEELGIPVCVQIGASFDFVAGGVARAPKWVQRIGFEWFYRMMQEPRRLAGRYASNIRFLAQAVGREMFAALFKLGIPWAKIRVRRMWTA